MAASRNATNATYTSAGGSIADNTAVSGGGVYVQENSSASLTGTELRNNVANGGFGGGAANRGGLQIRSTTVALNRAVANGSGQNGYGGGIYSASAVVNALPAVIVEDVTLSTNTAVFGGGIANLKPSNLTANRGVFSANAAAAGAGVWVGGNATIADSSFTDNDTNNPNGVGGGLLVGRLAAADSPSAVVRTSTFTGNSSSLGGAIGRSSVPA